MCKRKENRDMFELMPSKIYKEFSATQMINMELTSSGSFQNVAC